MTDFNQFSENDETKNLYQWIYLMLQTGNKQKNYDRNYNCGKSSICTYSDSLASFSDSVTLLISTI